MRRATRLTTSVSRNSASPAAIRPLRSSEPASPNRTAISAAIEPAPRSRTWVFALNTRLMIERDGDRLAERPTEAEQRGADDPVAAVRQDDLADHPPPGAAERERALALLAGHLRHHVARDRA